MRTEEFTEMETKLQNNTRSLMWWHVGEVVAFWICGGTLLIQRAALLPLWAAQGLHVLGFLIYLKVYLLIVNRCPDLDKKVKDIYRSNLWCLGITLVLYWIKLWQFILGAVMLTFSFAIIYRSWRFRDTGGHPAPWNDPVWKDWRFYPGW